MGKITALLNQMKSLCNMHNGEDTFFEPISIEKMTEWENENHAALCNELKEFYLFTNGMDLRIFFSTFCICKLDKLSFKEGGVLGYDDSDNFMKIGNFVGDGSVLCIDRNYNLYCAYEGNEIEECSLSILLEEELANLEEKIEENNQQ